MSNSSNMDTPYVKLNAVDEHKLTIVIKRKQSPLGVTSFQTNRPRRNGANEFCYDTARKTPKIKSLSVKLKRLAPNTVKHFTEGAVNKSSFSLSKLDENLYLSIDNCHQPKIVKCNFDAFLLKDSKVKSKSFVKMLRLSENEISNFTTKVISKETCSLVPEIVPELIEDSVMECILEKVSELTEVTSMECTLASDINPNDSVPIEIDNETNSSKNNIQELENKVENDIDAFSDTTEIVALKEYESETIKSLDSGVQMSELVEQIQPQESNSDTIVQDSSSSSSTECDSDSDTIENANSESTEIVSYEDRSEAKAPSYISSNVISESFYLPKEDSQNMAGEGTTVNISVLPNTSSPNSIRCVEGSCSSGWKCSEILSKLLYLESHIADLPNENYCFKCPLCREIVKDKASFSFHIYRHVALKPYRCQYCCREFYYSRSLYQHLCTKYRCYRCNESFERPNLIEEHNHCHITCEN